MVHTITALPGPSTDLLRLTLTSHSFLPFLRPRPQTAAISAISTSAPLYKPLTTAIPLTRSQRVADQIQREKSWEKESQRLLTLPFRQARHHLKNGLEGEKGGRLYRRGWKGLGSIGQG